MSLSCCLVHCCLSKSNSDSARVNSSRNSTTLRSWKAISVRNVALGSSRVETSSSDDTDGLVNTRSWRVGLDVKLISHRDPEETCLVGDNDRKGEEIGLAVETGAVALFVGGIVKLMRLRRGECVGREEPSSNRVGLTDFGDGLYTDSPETGLGTDSLDNRSTRVNFANPREEDRCCAVARSSFCGEGNAGTD